MQVLPVELQTLCLTFLRDDVATLKALRSTNKQLGCLATEALFEVAVINNDEDSGRRFVSLANSNINALVRCVIINTSDDPHHQGGNRPEAKISQSFTEAIQIMDACHNIEEVRLNFADECCSEEDWNQEVAETKEFRKKVLERVLGAIRRSDGVKSLFILNLQDRHDDELFEKEDFAIIRQRIRKLHLMLASESDWGAPEHDIEKPSLHAGFSDALPNIWLKPMGQQLTHLSVYGQELWGVLPMVDFRKVPQLPCLKSLSLGNFVLAHDWQIDWITAHSSTLSALYLGDCSIVTALRMNKEQAHANFPGLKQLKDDSEYPAGCDPEYHAESPLRWYDVFERFRKELSRLSHFAFGSGDWAWSGSRAFEERYGLRNSVHNSRYYMFHMGVGPSPWLTENPYDFEELGEVDEASETCVLREPCDREDEEALESLLQAVYQRVEERT